MVSTLSLTCFPFVSSYVYSSDLSTEDVSNHLQIAAARSVTGTGLIDALIDRYKTKHPEALVSLHKVGAVRALELGLEGVADLVITHHPPGEARFMEQGYGLLKTEIMYSAYAIIGPVDDKLDLRKKKDIFEVLSALRDAQAEFVVPSPRSGTYRKIEELWSLAGINPNWPSYEVSNNTSGETLLVASEFETYTLAEMGLYFSMRDEIGSQSLPLFKDDISLRNIYSAIVVNPAIANNKAHEAARLFHDFLIEADTQRFIQEYGERKFNSFYMTPYAHLDVNLQTRRNQEESIRNKNFFWLNLISSIFVIVLLGVSLVLAIRSKRLALKQLETARLAKSAYEASGFKSQFLAHMSHEIRTPLTSIVGFSNLLKANKTLDVKERQLLNIITDNSDHLLLLLNDILDLSKIESGELELDLQEFELVELVDTVKSLVASVRLKNLEFEINYKFPVPKIIKSDRTRLRQILVNLLGNAVKFTEQGKISLSIEFDQSTQRLYFSIQDSGVGMTPSQLNEVFSEYKQADGSVEHHYGGTGLGLPIAHTLTERLGGELSATSELDIGSCFTFFIDAGAVSASEMIDTLEEEIVQSRVDTHKLHSIEFGGSVLVAEDSVDIQYLLQTYLKRAGVDCVSVFNGREAVNICKDHKFDLIILDLEMPVMDGLQALNQLRINGVETPVVILTGNAMTVDKDRCMAAGSNDFLTKPITEAVFLQILEKYLLVDDHVQLDSGHSSASREEIPVELIKRFYRGLPGRLADVASLVESGDLEAALGSIHQLKGALGMYGFKDKCVLILQVEEALIEGDAERAVTHLKAVSEIEQIA